MAKRKLYLIAPFPPAISPASALSMFLLPELCEHYDVTCVVDDLTMTPDLTSFGAECIRERDLVRNTGLFRASHKLYILGNSYDCYHALELLEHAPGFVMLASRSLFDLVCERIRVDGNWPGDLFAYLKDKAPDQAQTIIDSIEKFGREPERFSDILPMIDILDDDGISCLSFNLLSSRILSAAGIKNIHTIAPPLSVFSQETPALLTMPDTWQIGIPYALDDEAKLRLDLALRDLNALGIKAEVHEEPFDHTKLIKKCDVIVDAHPGDRRTFSPLAWEALCRGKILICRDDGWADDIPGDSVFKAPAIGLPRETLVHAIAYLTRHVDAHSACLNAQNAYLKSIAETNFTRQFDQLYSQTPVPPASGLELLLPAQALPLASNTIATRYEGEPVAGACLLAGAPPARPILEKMFPHIDYEHSLLFASLSLVTRLSQLTQLPAPALLRTLGFQSPVLQTTSDGEHAHRDAYNAGVRLVEPSTLLQRFRNKMTRLAFGRAPVNEAIWMTDLSSYIKSFDVEFDILPFLLPQRFYQVCGDKRDGILVVGEPTRNCFNIHILTGLNAPLTLGSNLETGYLIIVDNLRTEYLSPKTTIPVTPDSNGVISFRLLLMDQNGRQIASFKDLQKAAEKLKLTLSL